MSLVSQSFQPGRTPLLSDVVIDTCGARIALFVVRIYLRGTCS
ncbi:MULTISPECIES: VanZ family protein [Bacillaceae]|nr:MULTISPECIES: VanZ family protein [Bacillaceae]